jgi:hypothetical protein
VNSTLDAIIERGALHSMVVELIQLASVTPALPKSQAYPSSGGNVELSPVVMVTTVCVPRSSLLGFKDEITGHVARTVPSLQLKLLELWHDVVDESMHRLHVGVSSVMHPAHPSSSSVQSDDYLVNAHVNKSTSWNNFNSKLNELKISNIFEIQLDVNWNDEMR